MSPDTDFPSESADVSLWPQLIDFMHLCNKARTPRNVQDIYAEIAKRYETPMSLRKGSYVADGKPHILRLPS